MSIRRFRSWDPDQALLIDYTTRDFIGEDHLARFVLYLVRKRGVDMTPFYVDYDPGPGQPPYHPAMLLAVSIYAWCRGVKSSRAIEDECAYRTDYKSITGGEAPSYRTFLNFWARHSAAIANLFDQTVSICDSVGMTKLGHVSIDGTKFQANASKHRTVDLARQHKAVLPADDLWLDEPRAAEAEEDGCDSLKDLYVIPKSLFRALEKQGRLVVSPVAVEADAVRAGA